MTQLLLFDAPTSNPSAVLPVTTAEPVTAERVTAERVTAERGVDSQSVVGQSSRNRFHPGSQSVATQRRAAENVADRTESEDGIHHMGDLARLVLLRYDLMAKRRAHFAARRRAR